MRLHVIICFFLIARNSYFKISEPINFIGTWKVRKVLIDKNAPMAKNAAALKIMKSMMLRTSYAFLADHRFKLLGEMQGQYAPEGTWLYDKANNIIEVKDNTKPAGKILTMHVNLGGNGSLLFKMLDAPVTLEVCKLR